MAKNWYKIGSGFDWLIPVCCLFVIGFVFTDVMQGSDARAEMPESSSSTSTSTTVPPTTVPPTTVPPTTVPPVVANVPTAAISPAIPVTTIAPAPLIALPIRGSAPAKNQVTARVYFGLRSPVLTAEGKQILKAAVQKVPKNKKFEVVVVGMVQDSDNVANIEPLSLGRAESVREYLRTLGIKGNYDVRIGGVVGETPVARRARATISYP